MTSATHHVVRVTMRIDIGSHHAGADLTVPSSSTLSELLPEFILLLDIPATTQPWEFATAAGHVLPQHVPVHDLDLRDGSIIVLRPEVPEASPVIRDAAEALAEHAHGTGGTRGLDTVAGIVGVTAGMWLATYAVPLVWAIAGGALIAALVGIYSRSQALTVSAIALAATASGMWVLGVERDASSFGFATITGASVAILLLAGAGCTRLVGTRVTATVATFLLVVEISAVGVWLPSESAPGALGVLAALAVIMAAPGVATRLSGLKIPRVPTAGEELPDATDHQPDVDHRALSAQLITDGMMAGMALGVLPALALLGLRGGEWAWALLVCLAGALVVYGSRHHYPVPRTALMVTVLAATLAAAAAITRPETHPVLLAVACAITLLPVTAPLWSRFVSELEPTTVVWLERAEQVAIIAAIPLALHVAGVFTMIRGL